MIKDIKRNVEYIHRKKIQKKDLTDKITTFDKHKIVCWLLNRKTTREESKMVE